MFKLVQTFLDLSKHVQTCSNLFRLVWTYSDLYKHVQTEKFLDMPQQVWKLDTFDTLETLQLVKLKKISSSSRIVCQLEENFFNLWSWRKFLQVEENFVNLKKIYSRIVQTCSDLSKHVQTCLNMFKPVQTCSDLCKPGIILLI